MVVSQQVFDSLRQIGLNLYERKLWVALLMRGTATAGELSSLAKVPHSRTYDVLESLSEKGFVMIQNAKPLRYMAIEPREALERSKKKIREDLNVMVDRINRFQNSSFVKELEKVYKQGVELVEPGELTSSLKGREALHQHLETLFKNAKNSISIITTADGLEDLASRHTDLLQKVSNKGIKIKIAASFNKENIPIIQKAKSFAEVRKINKPNLNGRFFIIDNSQIVLALTDDDVHPTQDLSLWTKSEHVANNFLGPLFNSLWQDLQSA